MLKAARADETFLATLRIVKARPASQSAVEEQALLHLANCAAWSVEGVFPSGGECIAALELAPNEPAVLMAAAHVQAGGDGHAALAHAQQAASLAPDSSEAHRVIGQVWELACCPEMKDMCRPEKAANEFREAIRLDPGNVAAHLELAWLLENRHKKAALQEFHEAERLAPNDASIHFYLGSFLRSNKDFDGALSEYADVLRLKPNSPEAHNQRAGILEEEGHVQAAIQEAKMGIEVDPSYVPVRYTLFRLLKNQGDWEGGMTQLREAATLNPDNLFLFMSMADSLREKGDIDGAIAVLRRGIQNSPGWANYHFFLGELLEQKGNFQEALEEYQEVAKLTGGSHQLEKKINHVRKKTGLSSE
jgi:tetratricopeptide (TPR) repeat protein